METAVDSPAAQKPHLLQERGGIRCLVTSPTLQHHQRWGNRPSIEEQSALHADHRRRPKLPLLRPQRGSISEVAGRTQEPADEEEGGMDEEKRYRIKCLSQEILDQGIDVGTF